MSAFVVTTAHIDLLVKAALQTSIGPYGYRFIWFAKDPDGLDDDPNDAQASDGFAEGAPWGSLAWYDENRRELTTANAEEVGAMLLAENMRSVNHRYADDEIEPVYQFRSTPDPRFDPVKVLKAIDGYAYQSCEHQGWQRSEAKRFIEALQARMISRLDGYDDASTWGVEKLSDAYPTYAGRTPTRG